MKHVRNGLKCRENLSATTSVLHIEQFCTSNYLIINANQRIFTSSICQFLSLLQGCWTIFSTRLNLYPTYKFCSSMALNTMKNRKDKFCHRLASSLKEMIIDIAIYNSELELKQKRINQTCGFKSRCIRLLSRRICSPATVKSTTFQHHYITHHWRCEK